MLFCLKTFSDHTFEEGNVVETKTELPPIVVRDRAVYGNTTTVAIKILDALEQRAKKMERKELPEDAMSLVTVDEFINVSATSNQVQDVLNRLLDRDGKGKDQIAFFSPYVINDKGKTVLKLALIHPPLRNNVRDARRLYEKCISTSIEYISRIFENRKKKSIDPLKGPQKFDIYFFSYANEFKRFVDSVFAHHKLHRLDTSDFEKKVLAGLAEQGFLTEVSKNYYIVSQDKGQDGEVRAHLTYLKTGLVDTSLTQEQKYNLQDIINQLELNTDKIDDEKNKIKLDELKSNLINRLIETAKNPDKRDLTWINFEKELQNIQYPKIEDAEILRSEMFNEFGGVSHINKEGLIVCCFVHPHYFSLVESHITRLSLTQPEYRKKLEWLKKIKQKIQSIPALDDEFDRKIPDEQRLELAKELATFKYQLENRLSKEKFDQKYDSSKGYTMLLISGLALGLMGLTFGPLGVIFGLVPAGIAVWWGFKKVDPNQKQSDKKEETIQPVAKQTEVKANPGEDRKKYYAGLGERLEKKLTTGSVKFISEKFLTDKKIEKKLEDLIADEPELLKIRDKQKLSAEFDRGMSTRFIKIRLPKEYVDAGQENYWIIPKSDWDAGKGRENSALIKEFKRLKEAEKPGSLRFKVFDHLERSSLYYHQPTYAKQYIVDKTK